jgi:sulfate permease, SulP family
VTREVLAGLVTTLALIPEVISFSIVAGVDPMVSLVASVVLVLSMTLLGGRPASVTAAAGSVALVIRPLVQAHGSQYVLPTVVLAGALQIIFGAAGLARLMRFVPRCVMIGFVNALGILIFAAQIRHVRNVPGIAYLFFVLTLAIILVLPRLTVAVPSPLVAIIVVTALVMLLNVDIPNVADEGSLSGTLPGLTPSLVPWNLDTLAVIWPTAISVAFVGLLESLLTAKLVDEQTHSSSSKGRESWALGVANIAAGFYGGIGGCAMIGQTVVNVRIGKARTRLSTAVAGVFLLVLITGLSSVMRQIPMVALAAVMMVVAVTTVDWNSLKPSSVKRLPAAETVIMLITVTVVVATGNLAYGVTVGVVLAMLPFARRIAHVVSVARAVADDGHSVTYRLNGMLFFASSNGLVNCFSYDDDPSAVVLDLQDAEILDVSAVAELDMIESRYRARGAIVTLGGLDERSSEFHTRMTGRLGV